MHQEIGSSSSFYFYLFICLWPEYSFTPVLSIHSYDSVVFTFVLSLCSIRLWSVLTRLLYLVVVAEQLYSWNFRALVAVQSTCSSYSLTLNCRWCVSYSRSILFSYSELQCPPSLLNKLDSSPASLNRLWARVCYPESLLLVQTHSGIPLSPFWLSFPHTSNNLSCIPAHPSPKPHSSSYSCSATFFGTLSWLNSRSLFLLLHKKYLETIPLALLSSFYLDIDSTASDASTVHTTRRSTRQSTPSRRSIIPNIVTPSLSPNSTSYHHNHVLWSLNIENIAPH